MLIPGQTLLVNSAPYLLRIKGTPQDEAFILATLSSMVLDWYARRFIVLNLNFHIFNGFPFPLVEKNDEKYKRLIQLVASLIDLDGNNDLWVKSLKVKFQKLANEFEKSEAIAELDALISILYLLDESDISHIYQTFHKTWNYQESLDRTIHFFNVWKGMNHD
jgi:hypothetical protein